MRCFVAVELNETIAAKLGTLQGELRRAGLRARWVDSGKMHLTLRFLGEVADREIEEVTGVLGKAATECQPFDIEIGGMGVFPERGAVRVIWVGVKDREGQLGRCRELIETGLESIGLAREGRGFSPHLTLGRSDLARESDRIRAVIGRHGPVSLGAQGVEEIVLFESELGKGGARYRVVSRHELGG